MDETVKRRRRGAALEDAVLNAAWEEIADLGYGSFTVDGVAERAGTSKAVLYRRWPGKAELARAAIEHFVQQRPMTVPDTGSLRDDVLAFLHQANERRVGIGAQLIARLGGFREETGTTIADLRDGMPAIHENVMTEIIGRAVARGEADPQRLTSRIMRLPADLFRLELLMTSRPVAEEDLIDIVDSVFLPLVR